MLQIRNCFFRGNIFFILLRHSGLTKIKADMHCPNCNSDLTYPNQKMMVCTQCFHEWEPAEDAPAADAVTKILDANGNELLNGDTVMVIKDLPVKGAAKPLKSGTKVKNIRLTDGDHNISCRIEGFGSMALKSEFVKKV
jgi:protein PhnA